jgi:hypothetical protein
VSPVWARNPSITGGPALKALEPVLDDRGELGEIAEPDVIITARAATSGGTSLPATSANDAPGIVPCRSVRDRVIWPPMGPGRP